MLYPPRKRDAKRLAAPKNMKIFFFFNSGLIMDCPILTSVAEHNVKKSPPKEAMRGYFYSYVNTDCFVLAI